MKDSNIY